MHILFLSDNFPPESNAPATRLYEHAVRWVDAGHRVTVVTCAPNFPEGVVFPGYRNRWYSVEDVDGIRVVRVRTYITPNEGFVRRILDYLSFMVSGTIAGIGQRRPDVVVASSPQFFAAVAGWLVSAVKRRPFVFEVRDLWPASIIAVGAMKKNLMIRLLERLELFLYRRATRVVTVTGAFKRDLVTRHIPADKIDVVRNGVDLRRFEPRAAEPGTAAELGLDGCFVVGYIGTHGLAHGLETVIEAAEHLRERTDIAFLFVGSGAAKEDIEARVADKKLTNVTLLPRQPKERMPELNALCDLAVVPLRDNATFTTVLPSKIFECMAMGVPMLVSVPEGEATELVREHQCGVVVPPEAPQQMADTITALTADPEHMQAMQTACVAAAPYFSRDKQADAMLHAISNSLSGEARTQAS